jgi:hypothetical protein
MVDGVPGGDPPTPEIRLGEYCSPGLFASRTRVLTPVPWAPETRSTIIKPLRAISDIPSGKRFRRDAEHHTRDECAPRKYRPRALPGAKVRVRSDLR